tara:strand:+ start:172 stop:1026 length:855 start_codon:yes stop_codon:yes gene_type:complete
MKYFLKKISLFVILYLIWPTPLQTARANSGSSGPDRCFIDGCLCRVIPDFELNKSKKTSEKTFVSIYFDENQHILNDEDVDFLNIFFSAIKNKYQKASIIGYTDGCGSPAYNYKLSHNRAKSVYDIAKKFIDPTMIRLKSGGEAHSLHVSSAKRVDIILHKEGRIATVVEKIPSDFYLIDASGSMQNKYNVWNQILKASLKPGSKVYLSITNGCNNGELMSRVSPNGGTEIWWSYWNIIDKMKPGNTLLIISDFNSRVPLSKREAAMFERKVRDKKILVRSISL